MKKLWATLALVVGLLISPLANAEEILYTPHTFHEAATSAIAGTPLYVEKYATVGVHVTISDTATVSFKITAGVVGDDTIFSDVFCIRTSDTAATPVISTTSSGDFQCNVGAMKFFYTPISAYTSGTIKVTGRASTAVIGSTGGGRTGCVPSALAPTYLEAVTNWLSCNLAGAVRMVMETLLAGEDQLAQLFQVSGGSVRQQPVTVNVTGNATSSTFTLKTGLKSPFWRLVCNAGASTDCAAVVTLYGNSENSTSTGEAIGSLTFATGAASRNGVFPEFKRDWAYYYIGYTGFAGTSPVLNGWVHF